MFMLRGRTVIAVTVCCLAAAAVYLGCPRRPTAPPARDPTEVTLDSGGGGRGKTAPPADLNRTKRILVRSDPPLRGQVPVAVADAERILFLVTAALGEPIDLAGRVPSNGPIVIGPIDDLSGSATLAELAATQRWPRTVVAETGEWPRDLTLEFSRTEPASRIRIVAQTLAPEPCPGVVFRVSAVTEATTAVFPVAFISTDREGVARSPALAPGAYRVSLQRCPDLFRPLDERPTDLVIVEHREHEVRVVFEAAGSLRGEVRLEPVRPCSVTIAALDRALPFLRSVDADEAGCFELATLPPGRYAALCWPEEYMETAVEFEVFPGRQAQLVLSPARASEGIEVRGRLVDADGEAILRTDANVNGLLSPGQAPSGKGCRFEPTGTFRVNGVAPGEKVLILWRHGHMFRFAVPSDTKTLDLGTIVVPRPSGTGSVTGHVEDDRGVPLAGTHVCLAPAEEDRWSRFAATNGRGEYRFADVAPGRYRIWHQPTTATNYVESAPPTDIVVPEGEMVHEFHLPRR